MGWLAILRALLGFTSSLATYLNNKQLLDAGEAKAIVEGISNAHNAIKKAQEARRSAVDNFIKRMHDKDDPNRRD